ncbi:MAG: hypothetical protein ACFFE4_00350 [Candidatus Thorarchaeota archaeon]
MVNEQLVNSLNFIGERVKGLGYDLKLETDLFFEILERKKEEFEEFQEKIILKWNDFIQKNQERIIKRTFTTFFYETFQSLFSYFLLHFFGFNENSLEMTNKEKISEEFLLFDYSYYLTQEENDIFQKISRKFESEVFYGYSFPMGYLYFLVRLLGIIFRKSIKKNTFIQLDAIIVNNQKDTKSLRFMIIVKDSKDEIFHSYFNMVLYYFLRPFEGISEEYLNNLLKGREKLYQMALKAYPSAKEKLVDLLYYFYKKCSLLQSFSPLLDFFNFVGARAEDSIFSKLDIVRKEFLVNLDDYSTEKKNALIRFFEFLDNKSTLYSTFQANNLPSQKSQLNLFLLYMKYYFGSGLEALEVGDLLFLPSIFKKVLDKHNMKSDDVIGANSIKNINNLLNYLYSLSNIEHIDLFFIKIFNNAVSHLNYGFFKTFLKSFNSNFALKIKQENEALSDNPENEPFTFDIIVEHMCRILYVIIDKIFLRQNPDDASENFIDPRSRYIGKNIALRVLELFVFQDINYSDDIWPDFVISLNKEQIKEEIKERFNIIIPETKFYTDEELTQIMITYNIQSLSDQPYFEEWLITQIIIPLNNFILYIRNSVQDPSNKIEVYEQLSKFFLSGINDNETIKEIKFICQEIAPFWKNIDRFK